MDKDAATQGLHDAADRILRLIAAVRNLLNAGAPDRAQPLVATRLAMMHAIDAFITYKEERVLLPVLQAGDEAAARAAREIRDRNYRLQDEYNAFVVRWAITDPASVSAGYMAEAHAIATRIEQQIGEDVRELARLIAAVRAQDRPAA